MWSSTSPGDTAHVRLSILILLVAGGAADSQTARAQTPTPHPAALARHSMYVELGGAGGLYSVNYSRRIATRRVLRVGVTASPLAIGVPVSLSTLYGSGDWRPEAGIGLLLARSSDVGVDRHGLLTAVGPIVGYRHHPQTRGLFVRASLQPLLFAVLWTQQPSHSSSTDTDRGLIPWGGVSVGWSF